jgi:catechol 2,3-dioxygenase-like lactoylglutathione lyase family enzyme
MESAMLTVSNTVSASQMKFNHISFPSHDVSATASFFVRHLGCIESDFGTTKILKRHDFDIVVEDARDRAIQWPGNFHIGFELPTAAAVIALYEDLKAAGVTFETEVIRHVRGSRFFCWIPGGVMVEINTREDAAESYRAGFGLA